MNLDEARQLKQKSIKIVDERQKIRSVLKFIMGVLVDNEIYFEYNSGDDQIDFSFDGFIRVEPNNRVWIEFADLNGETCYGLNTDDDNWQDRLTNTIISVYEETSNG